jgi:hypothetical protein
MPEGTGERKRAPSRLLWNGAVTEVRRTQGESTCTGHAANGSAAMPSPSVEVASGPTG